MKVRAAFAIVAVGLGALVAGCGGSDSTTTEKPKSLTVLIVPSPSATALKAIAPAYTKKTGVDIRFVSVPYDQHATKLVLDGQSKSASFDIAQFDQPFLAAIVPVDGLAPLDKLIDSDQAYDIDDFQEPLQAYAQLEGVTYGIPLSTEPYVNFYRTDIYKQMGLKPATTWEQVDSNAAAVSAKGGTHFGWAGPYGPTIDSGPEYFERLLQHGGRLLDPETFEPLLDTPIAIQTMQDFIDLAKYAPPATKSGTSGDSATAFTQFNVGSNVQPSGWWGTLNDPKASKAAGKVGVATVPAGSGGPYPPVNILKGWLIGINGNSRYQQAAWDFLSFALGKENVQAFIDAGAPLAGRISTLRNPEYNAELPYLEHLLPGIESGTTLPTIPELGEITTLVCQAISSMANQGGDVESTMKSLNGKVRKVLVTSGRLKD